MKITELIRGLLDVIDGVERSQTDPAPADTAYSDRDIKRFKQIIDLADTDAASEYANEPKEQYADIEAVTQDAGADSWQGTKDPADIRGDSVRIYGDN